jgi:hypothetical protein
MRVRCGKDCQDLYANEDMCIQGLVKTDLAETGAVPKWQRSPGQRCRSVCIKMITHAFIHINLHPFSWVSSHHCDSWTLNVTSVYASHGRARTCRSWPRQRRMPSTENVETISIRTAFGERHAHANHRKRVEKQSNMVSSPHTHTHTHTHHAPVNIHARLCSRTVAQSASPKGVMHCFPKVSSNVDRREREMTYRAACGLVADMRDAGALWPAMRQGQIAKWHDHHEETNDFRPEMASSYHAQESEDQRGCQGLSQGGGCLPCSPGVERDGGHVLLAVVCGGRGFLWCEQASGP